jgi:hypothetical protein
MPPTYILPNIRYVRSDAQALGGLGRADDAAQLLLALAQDQTVEDYVRSDAYRRLKALLGGEKDEG